MSKRSGMLEVECCKILKFVPQLMIAPSIMIIVYDYYVASVPTYRPKYWA